MTFRYGTSSKIARRNRRLSFDHHVCHLMFDRLKAADSTTKLNAILSVGHGSFQASLRSPHRFCSERYPCSIESSSNSIRRDITPGEQLQLTEV